jgi:hypothetical protein
MATKKRPIHRGISDFALWALVNSRGSAILAGCKVTLHTARPHPHKPAGYFEVQVSGEGSTSVYWMDVTTSEFEQRRASMAQSDKQRKAMARRNRMPI